MTEAVVNVCKYVKHRIYSRNAVTCLFTSIVIIAIWNILSVWMLGITIIIPRSVQHFLAMNPDSILLIKVQNPATDTPEKRADLMEWRFAEMERNLTSEDLTSMAAEIDSLYDKKKTRSRVCKDCFNVNFDFIIDTNVCLKGPKIDLIYLVFSKNSNFEQRQALRETWLSDLPTNQTYVFFVGKTQSGSDRQKQISESDTYKDIVMINFVDSYLNLTFKSLMAFKWVSGKAKCSRATHVMKVDDDVYVNTKELTNILKTQIERNKHFSLGGFCIHGSPPFRDRNSKYYAPFNSYSKPFYPPFCSGTAYLTNMRTVRNILLVSPTVPFFHLEDVYIAMCLQELGLRVKDIRGFNVWRVMPTSCLNKSPLVVTSHGLSPLELRQLWKTDCPFTNWTFVEYNTIRRKFNDYMIEHINKIRKKHLVKKRLVQLRRKAKKKRNMFLRP